MLSTWCIAKSKFKNGQGDLLCNNHIHDTFISNEYILLIIKEYFEFVLNQLKHNSEQLGLIRICLSFLLSVKNLNIQRCLSCEVSVVFFSSISTSLRGWTAFWIFWKRKCMFPYSGSWIHVCCFPVCKTYKHVWICQLRGRGCTFHPNARK